MIHELDKDEYEKVQCLFQPLEYNLITRAVIEGANPGRVFVDDDVRPRSAFLCSTEGYFLAGEPDNPGFNKSLNRLIVERIFKGETVREDEEDLTLCLYPKTWEPQLDVIVKGRSPIIIPRRHYLCTEKKLDWRGKVPRGFAIHRIDEKLLNRTDLEIPNHVINWMKTWGSIDEFLRRGFGFCILRGTEFASWCISDCVSGNDCEIGIHTIPRYRRRGLATLVVARTVDYCFSHGLKTVGWQTNEDNLGSIGVAEKVGFERKTDYLHYEYLFDKTAHQAETAYSFFKRKQYRDSIKLYEKIFAMENDVPYYYYHSAARVYAAVGDQDNAFKYLEIAIERGWRHLDFTRSCEEYKNLKDTKKWKQIIQNLKKLTG